MKIWKCYITNDAFYSPIFFLYAIYIDQAQIVTFPSFLGNCKFKGEFSSVFLNSTFWKSKIFKKCCMKLGFLQKLSV